MMKYIASIVETLQHDIPVEADSEEEARDIVEDGWYKGKYVLDSGDFVDVDMYIQKVEE